MVGDTYEVFLLELVPSRVVSSSLEVMYMCRKGEYSYSIRSIKYTVRKIILSQHTASAKRTCSMRQAICLEPIIY